MTHGEPSSPLPSALSPASGAANERNGAWRLLLPAVIDGTVAFVDLLPGTAAAFRRSYPDAITVSNDEAALAGVSNGRLWDGRRWPLPERSVALLVADERRLDPSALATALRPGGIRASIVPARRSRGLVPYPTPEELECILQPRWPASTRAPRRWSRERLATSPAWRLSSRAGLLIDGCDAGLVDEVVSDVGLATGSDARLRGFLVSSGDNVVLRVALATRQVAVRVGITELGAHRLARQRRVLAGIESTLTSTRLCAHMPREVALGTTRGLPWRAETWHDGHLTTRGRRWRAQAPAWDATHAVARLLSDTAPTGQAEPGWTRSWLVGMEHFGPDVAGPLETALSPVEDLRVRTSWCHGDLWPGNVVLARGRVVLIDWEQGRRDGPVGVDRVFLEMNRLMLGAGISFGIAAARAARTPAALISPPDVNGVPWGQADPALRIALIAAAVAVHASGPEGDRRGRAWAETNITPFLSAVAASTR